VTGKKADRDLALDKMAEAIAAIRSGERPRKFEPIAVQQMFDTWIQECERKCQSSTVADYKRRWNNHLEPAFGRLLATQVNKDRLVA
jgi:protein gp37